MSEGFSVPKTMNLLRGEEKKKESSVIKYIARAELGN